MPIGSEALSVETDARPYRALTPIAERAIARTIRRSGASSEATIISSTWTADDLIAWIEREFYIPERKGLDNPAMPLADYQKAALHEAHRRTPDGKFVYDLVLWSDIKKSAKSSIAAAVILFRALHTDYGSFKIVANDLKQADSRVFHYIRRAIELNPALGKRATVKNYRIALDNRTVIEAIPVDPKGEAGGNDDFIEFTELHAAGSKAALAMWTEMTISPTKHGYSQRWIDTYAGHSGESPVLEPLYFTCVKEGQRLDDEIEMYANGSMFCLWNTRPRLEWQTPDYYASESKVHVVNEYRRVHENQWTTSADVFVPGEWWDACQGEVPDSMERESFVFALDAAVSGDCFAIIGVSRKGDLVRKRYCRIWTPPKGGKIEYSNVNDPTDRNYPEGEIRHLAKIYNVVEWAYDAYQLHDLCTRLLRLGIGWFREFPQGQDRLKADKQLFDDIRDRKIVHDGDPVLSDHVKNANAQTDPQDHSLRIVKRAEHLKIDACVALSMSNSEARRLQIG